MIDDEIIRKEVDVLDELNKCNSVEQMAELLFNFYNEGYKISRKNLRPFAINKHLKFIKFRKKSDKEREIEELELRLKNLKNEAIETNETIERN